jgi:hypothetical protein
MIKMAMLSILDQARYFEKLKSQWMDPERRPTDPLSGGRQLMRVTTLVTGALHLIPGLTDSLREVVTREHHMLEFSVHSL